MLSFQFVFVAHVYAYECLYPTSSPANLLNSSTLLIICHCILLDFKLKKVLHTEHTYLISFTPFLLFVLVSSLQGGNDGIIL